MPLVCFHGWPSCVACWPPSGRRPALRRPRARCVTCGRFRRRQPPEVRCPRCIEAGFVALTLF